MNKTTEALLARIEKLEAAAKLSEEALASIAYEKPSPVTVEALADIAFKALRAIREVLADHSGDANAMVMDWSKVKPEAIKSDPMYQMGYAAAMSKFAAQFQAEPVKQEPVAWLWKMHGWTVTAHGKHRAIKSYVDVCQPPLETQASDDFIELTQLYAAPVQPVKQEPVAWHEPNAYGNVTTHKKWALENEWLPLYTKE